MTLLTIAQYVAKNASLKVPDTVETSDDDAVRIVQFINEAGAECARRVDWSVLRKSHLITGAGVDTAYPLPSDYARLTRGMSVRVADGAIRGGLSPDEWLSLSPVMGAPRFYRIDAARIGFYPYPIGGASIRVQYVSGNWAVTDNGGGISVMTRNTDAALISETLIARGAVWRLRRHIAADYEDYLAEFEAMLADLSTADGAVRIP